MFTNFYIFYGFHFTNGGPMIAGRIASVQLQAAFILSSLIIYKTWQITYGDTI